jgi:hypothetical protein
MMMNWGPWNALERVENAETNPGDADFAAALVMIAPLPLSHAEKAEVGGGLPFSCTQEILC